MTSRKEFLKQFGLGTVSLSAFSIIPATESSAKISKANKIGKRNDYYISNKQPLNAQPYTELPIGKIKPKGWLLEQLQRQKNGLTGDLDKVYSRVVGDSNGWLGGDGDGWERGPYWLDGLVPLAYLLDDEKLKQKAQRWIEWSINNQREDGYFGPKPFDKKPKPEPGVQKTPRKDWWPKMVMLKVLKQYYMATEDDRVLTLMTNYFRFQLKNLPDKPLGHWSFWAERRGADNLQIVYWLYNRTGDKFLLELGKLIHKQTHDWTELINDGKIASVSPLPHIHGVNMAQGIKAPVVYYQQDTDEMYIRAVKKGLEDLRKVHGFVNGMYGGDERLHGSTPTQGSELCSAVELMYSLESMLPITGDISFADHLEKIAFNALPTQVNDDYTDKQYFQQANQVLITNETRHFFNDDNARICYGVLSGYPCCVSNMHQGWPKLVQNLWYATAGNGLAAMIYSSNDVTAKVGSKGTEVTISEETNYPFDDTISFTIKSPENVKFPLQFRIPEWTKGASYHINGKGKTSVKNNQMISIDRQWADGDQITLQLPMDIRTSRWAEESIGIERGPLVYALKIGERWEKKQPDPENRALENPYYNVYPTGDWNYGLLEEAVKNNDFTFEQGNFDGKYPWNLENVPVQLAAKGKQIADWKIEKNQAGPLPLSPVRGHENQASKEITLIPYGATTLRISEFPVVV